LFNRTHTCRWLIIFCQVEAVGTYEQILGKKYKRGMAWRKRDGTPQYSGDRPGMGYESIVAAWGQGGHPRWNGGGKHGFYDYPVDDGEARWHQTQKPLTLMRALLQDFTDPGDTIYDPFMGSGSTGVACVQLGRRFLGVERDPATFQVAGRRLEDACAQGQLFAEARPATQARLL
jgi:site-specific DNA-methyltransferase (adenine-specific)